MSLAADNLASMALRRFQDVRPVGSSCGEPFRLVSAAVEAIAGAAGDLDMGLLVDIQLCKGVGGSSNPVGGTVIADNGAGARTMELTWGLLLLVGQFGLSIYLKAPNAAERIVAALADFVAP